MLLRHGRELIGFLPLEELHSTYAYHSRLQVFAEKGLECATCDRVGAFLILSRENVSKRAVKRGSVGRVHVDLYTEDFVLMTVDHIVPKYIARQNGWTKLMIECLDNKQPMCDDCNNGKGHKIVSDEEQLARKQKLKRQSRRIEGHDALLEIIPNIHALLGERNEITSLTRA